MYGIEHRAASDVPGVVVLGSSAGGIEALSALLPRLPMSFPLPLVIAHHLCSGDAYRSRLTEVLQRRSALPVAWADGGMPIRPGHVYVCPQDRQLCFLGRSAFLVEPSTNRYRPRISDVFRAASNSWGKGAIGVVLSGCLDDGASGALAICDAGGIVLLQDEASSSFADMPRASLRAGANALILSAEVIAAALVALTMAPASREWLRVRCGSGYLATAS